jgi:hypothetical protein
MGTSDWLASRLADQATQFENIKSKIANYTAELGLTPAQVTAITRICDEFDVAYSNVEQLRATTVALVQWRDQVFRGTPQGAPAPQPPEIDPNQLPPGSKIGIIAEFRDLRDIILASPGYTDAIGQDLMILAGGGGSGTAPPPIDDLAPDLKTQVGSGYEVNLAGPMRGMDAMRVEWQRNGDSTWSLVGFLTRTPGDVIITPHTQGEPDAGEVRARYIKNNVPVGNYSASYPVTVSA